MRTFKVTRTPEHPGRSGNRDTFLILIDGQQIGGTFRCAYNPAAVIGWGRDDGGIKGESWASWGPRGLSCGHPDREAAEQAQFREYVTNPDLFDRLLAAARANAGARP